MKNLHLSAILFALCAGSAAAADLPSRKAPPVYVPRAPVMTWTGFYVGVNAGYKWGVSPFVTPRQSISELRAVNPINASERAIAVAAAIGASTILPANLDSFAGGGQIGWNWQFAPRWVAGVEADIQVFSKQSAQSSRASLTDVAGLGGYQIGTFSHGSRTQEYLGTVRGRIGFLATPSLMIYATGGLAYGQVKERYGALQDLIEVPLGPFFAPPWTGSSAAAATRVGWTAGGGFEWMFSPNWSFKGEYLYYSLGGVSTPRYGVVDPTSNRFVNFGPGWLNVVNARTRFDGHMARAGLNYHFGSEAAPIVARY